MGKLWSVLKKPDRLEEYVQADIRKQQPWWQNTRLQIKILHTICVLYVLMVCSSVNYFGVTLGLPVIHEDSMQLFIAQVLLTYLCTSGIINYLFILYFAEKSHFGPKKTSRLPFQVVDRLGKNDWISGEDNAGEISSVTSDWRKCSHCNIQVPPRARHCSICQTCVLKKDHHCFFTGCCIGYYNQQFFVKYAFFGVLGGTWGLLSLLAYLNSSYAPVFSLNIYQYFLPICVLSTFFGASSFSQMFLVVLAYLNFMCVVTAVYFFTYQVLVIVRGQTSYELVKKMKKKMYGNDLNTNIRSVFGPYWILGFLFPLPILRNEGDGMNWRKTAKLQ